MKKTNTSKKYGTDFARLDAMRDEDIDLSEIPEATAEDFARGVVVPPLKERFPREELTVHLDRDLAAWYRDRDGVDGLINFLLRRHMQEQVGKPKFPQTRRAS
jgi:uncharacterized protein (DUF4415 family)